jgi:hypothetical protein
MTVTGDDSLDHPDPSGPEGDYSYDLVHDEVPVSQRHVRGAARHGGPAAQPEADAGGDYSYDLAHEVPPSRPR